MNNKIKVIISWGLVILWMGFIFNFSNMDTNESNTKSKDTIEKVVDTTIDTSSKIGITKDDVSDDKIEGIIYEKWKSNNRNTLATIEVVKDGNDWLINRIDILSSE